MSRKLLKMEKLIKREQAAEKLESLADKFGEGKIELESGNDSVKLNPSEEIDFELEVEKESDNKISLEIELEWFENKDTDSINIS